MDIQAPPSERPWPELRPARAEPCDGVNPTSQLNCTLRYHDGYHRDAAGAEWLDD